MAIDSQLAMLFETTPALAASPRLGTSAVEIRAALESAKATFIREPWLPGVVDVDIPSEHGRPIPARVYTPEGDGPFPLVLYFHGGGWSVGDLDSSDGLCRSTARGAGCVLVSVDYRLAPEHKFPAALDDCVAATLWCAEHPGELAIDPARIAVMGDSAGGNLASSVTHVLRGRGGPAIAFQLLYYPCTDLRLILPSIVENGHAPCLTAEALEWSVGNYLPEAAEASDPLASPALAASFQGLPPAMIRVAGLDPLRDDGAAYAELLRGGGVAVDYRCHDSLTHSYLRFAGQVDLAAEALQEGIMALRRTLHG